MIDLWSNDDDLEAIARERRRQLWGTLISTPEDDEVKEEKIHDAGTVPAGYEIFVDVKTSVLDNDVVLLTSVNDFTDLPEFSSLMNVTLSESSQYHHLTMPLRPLNAFILRYALRGAKAKINPESAALLTEAANKVPMPQGKLSHDGKKIEFIVPGAEPYKAIMRKLDAYPARNGKMWTANVSRGMDVELMCENSLAALPHIHLDESVTRLITEPIPGFDGTLECLKEISIGELNLVKANAQTRANLKKSSKTMQEKMEMFGIKTIYDLLLHLPRRYIDKSNPQEIRDLVVDEPATIVGTITDIDDLRNDMGAKFIVETGAMQEIQVNFWRQPWLKAKFSLGSEVIITGKFTVWNEKPQLNGTSIEHSEEAVLLPIMPVYSQSESKGITTAFLVSAARELFSRIGEIQLPEFLQKPGRVGYHEAYQELHLPSSLEHHRKVIDALAYYELVNMQLIIQDELMNTVDKPGVSMMESERGLQRKAIELLPFELTAGQAEAVEKMNSKMAGASPTATLLNAEVGSGKTIISQLACLRAVEAGRQAVLIGPTDVLARQLYNTFERVVEPLNNAGEKINVAFLSSAVKAVEKKKILKAVKAGEVDVLVGTHSLISATTEYADLGLICVDEQQKFGAEMRSQLLNSRTDGAVPDLLMQSATPIPRSTAQVFYGEIDMILLTDKPKGRLPIKTVWVEEDPNEMIEHLAHPVWSDIINEAEQGNQSFIITPLVRDSDKVDAASAERSFKSLTEGVLSGLRVGMVHGQMKPAEQREVMEAFRDKQYDVMVASTIVEVGVDIPDATRVVVLSADRLGSSSLHQIRGRVGRNSKPSKCYLVSLGLTENAQHRLSSLVEYENGFDVAKSDLELRGEGQIFGSTQSGASEMIFATLASHGDKIPAAKEEALEILSSEWREEALRLAKENLNVQGNFK